MFPGDAIAAAESLSAAFEHVAETIAPSVVTIRSTKEIEAPAAMQRIPRQFFFNSPFEDFFGDNFFHRFEVPQRPGQRQFQQGEGSGVVVSEDGFASKCAGLLFAPGPTGSRTTPPRELGGVGRWVRGLRRGFASD